MASNSNTARLQEIRDLHNRVEWLDDERRKMARKLSEQEQRLTFQEREIEGREQRIQDLEKQISTVSAQLSRLTQVDTQLSQFKDEIVVMIEQYDQRRVRSENEIDRLRRVEHEVTARELADIRKELPAIDRLETAMELRFAEEARLANLIGVQQNKIQILQNLIDAREQALSFLEEKEKQNSRNITDAQSTILEMGKRWDPIRDQLELLSANLISIETNQKDLAQEQVQIRESLKSWLEQVQIGEYERNKRLENWQRVLDENEETLKRYSKEWVTFSDQYKESKMAVQTLSDWQSTLEQQQREASELLRIESHRMESRWDDFLLDNERSWKGFTVESEQRWTNLNRYEKQIQEQIMTLDEWITRLEQEQDLVRRVQTAQADAIKRLPLLWMEEVEKAIAQNPNRRRQPALVPVREE